MNPRKLLLLIVGLFATTSSFAQPAIGARTRPAPAAAPMILTRALAAEGRLRYSGERIVQIRQGADLRSHAELVIQNGASTRVWFPADSPYYGQVIVETSKERRHYYPKQNSIEILPPKAQDAYLRLRQWAQHPGPNIRLAAEKGGVVAGRLTELATVSDAHGNVKQRIWIDSLTGLVLRRELLDDVGDRRDYFEYIKVNYSPTILPQDFQITVKGARIVTLADKVRILAAQLRLLPVSLPASSGFSLDGVNMAKPDGVDALHEAYTGPKGKLSLFQMRGAVAEGAFGPTKAKGVQFFGWTMNGNSFALVGAYPADQMLQLAESIGAPRNGR